MYRGKSVRDVEERMGLGHIRAMQDRSPWEADEGAMGRGSIWAGGIDI